MERSLGPAEPARFIPPSRLPPYLRTEDRIQSGPAVVVSVTDLRYFLNRRWIDLVLKRQPESRVRQPSGNLAEPYSLSAPSTR